MRKTSNGMRKTHQMLGLEAKYGQPIEKLITSAITEHNSITDAAASMGVNVKTFWGWMVRLRIQTKRVAYVA